MTISSAAKLASAEPEAGPHSPPGELLPSAGEELNGDFAPVDVHPHLVAPRRATQTRASDIGPGHTVHDASCGQRFCKNDVVGGHQGVPTANASQVNGDFLCLGCGRRCQSDQCPVYAYFIVIPPQE